MGVIIGILTVNTPGFVPGQRKGVRRAARRDIARVSPCGGSIKPKPNGFRL